jgi:hypothetical protein
MICSFFINSIIEFSKMRQSDNTVHINPAQLKLSHHSPGRSQKGINVLGESTNHSLMMRTAESGFMNNSSMSSGFSYARSPPKNGQNSVLSF